MATFLGPKLQGGKGIQPIVETWHGKSQAKQLKMVKMISNWKEGVLMESIDRCISWCPPPIPVVWHEGLRPHPISIEVLEWLSLF